MTGSYPASTAGLGLPSVKRASSDRCIAGEMPASDYRSACPICIISGCPTARELKHVHTEVAARQAEHL